jgi:hypothetical protein
MPYTLFQGGRRRRRRRAPAALALLLVLAAAAAAVAMKLTGEPVAPETEAVAVWPPAPEPRVHVAVARPEASVVLLVGASDPLAAWVAQVT